MKAALSTLSFVYLRALVVNGLFILNPAADCPRKNSTRPL